MLFIYDFFCKFAATSTYMEDVGQHIRVRFPKDVRFVLITLLIKLQ